MARTRASTSSASTACSAPMPASARAISSRSARPQSKPATRVVFAPAQPNIRLQGSAEALKRSFAGRPLVEGDIGRDHRPPAGQRRHARRTSARCSTRRPSRCRNSGWSVVIDRAQGHRPHRRQDRRSSCCPNIPRRTASAAPTSPMTTSAACATRSTRCARWSSCRCAIPSCSSASASIRPRACCSTARPAPARPGSRAPSPTKATRNSSTSPAPRSWARPMARARSGCARCSSRPPQAAPSIIFIDEIDSIAPKRGQVTGEAEKRLVAQLLTPAGRDRAAPEPGRHRRDQPARSDRRGAAPPRPLRPRDRRRRARRDRAGARSSASTPAACRSAPDVDLDELARRTYGFVGADLAALTREAALEAVRRIMPQAQPRRRARSRPRCSTRCRSSRDDFDNALKRVQPSAMREVMVEAPTDRLGRYRRARRGARPAARRRRAAAQASRSVPPARHPPGQGLPALRPARHRQDPARQGRRRARARPISSPPNRPTCCQQMVRRERAADRAPVRPRPPGRADGHLHRRARQPGAGARRRPRRAAGDRARGQHHPRRDGRARGAATMSS